MKIIILCSNMDEGGFKECHQWLTGEEQDKVFQFIPQKDLPVFEFMRHYGCRVNETIGLLRENVFEDYSVISSILDFRGDRRASTKTKHVKVLPIIAEIKWIIDLVDPPFI